MANTPPALSAARRRALGELMLIVRPVLLGYMTWSGFTSSMSETESMYCTPLPMMAYCVSPLRRRSLPATIIESMPFWCRKASGTPRIFTRCCALRYESKALSSTISYTSSTPSIPSIRRIRAYVHRERLAAGRLDLEFRVERTVQAAEQVFEAVEHRQYDHQGHGSHRHPDHGDDGNHVDEVLLLAGEEIPLGNEVREVQAQLRVKGVKKYRE
jgi:hypothetical protein